MNQIQDMLQTVYLGTKYGLNDGHARARMGEHVTKRISLPYFSYQEHFLKVSSKSDEPNSRYIENGIFWDKYGLIWAEMMGMSRQE